MVVGWFPGRSGACVALALVTWAGCSSVTDVSTCTVRSEVEFAPEISTVATVTWRVNGVEPRTARVEFWRSGSESRFVAPAPLVGEGPHDAVLLGMKPSSEYAYQIFVNGDECVSEPQTLVTGSVNPELPRLTFETGTALSPGFYVLNSGFGADIPGGPSKWTYIIDQDGDPVWWWRAPLPSSRSTPSWDGQYMYMLALNVSASAASLARVKMDGTDARELRAIGNVHHDFTVTPSGSIVAIVHAGTSDGVVEYDPSTDSVRALVPDVEVLYRKGRPEYHANAITYLQHDDSFILGDRFPNLYVKFDHAGELKWQFGGTDPIGPAFSGTGTWMANHGLHWTDDGRMLVFSNGSVATSKVLEFAVDEAKLEARLLREYSTRGVSSAVLGDVQQLPNKNVLATFSTAGRLIEYDTDGETVAAVKASISLGYTTYRRQLYGPPDK